MAIWTRVEPEEKLGLWGQTADRETLTEADVEWGVYL